MLQDPAYFFAKLPEFMKWQANIMGEPIPLPEKLSRNVPTFIGLMSTSARWLLLPGFIWGIASVFRHREEDRARSVLVISALTTCALLAIAVITSRDVVRDTDLLPIHTFAILLFGLMAADFYNRRDAGNPCWWKHPGALILGGTTCIVFAGAAIRDSAAFTREDTRLVARDWCRSKIPAGSRVLRERYTLPIGVSGIHEVNFRHFASKLAQQLIRSGEFDYLVTSSLAYGRFFDRASPFYNEAAQETYRALTNYCRPHVEFGDVRRLPFAHPSITVYSRPSP